ncbi:ABC transporter ATP-binding protein [Methanonatronarchaeum sp. AMET6-2]|uniref:ABC transporter ATP-binding protein n=1 Tax=Methanonatronarchaeum sp. AMET6-2 TaxID=2933293 RepID=UPI00120C363E|nr:ABC transporter ATP-binding protein [Methanonatronarchaeum sp. AMET6-2]RZN62330.1 MAG: ABC transporter ATP-binding protein [Methanonatronarchaeia archaeon]UOY09573.1 ABC transporter ATP-binding protein [Methanonatronarchaeum sp. AMET6-2]
MLKIKNLTVSVKDKVILKDLNLHIDQGEAHVLFGPNGSGKSTLLKTIMGLPGYRVLSGSIRFNGKEITDLPVHERVELGLALEYQNPPQIDGLKLKDLIELISEVPDQEIKEMAGKLNLESHMDREVNVGFSGGEVKRSEILQVYSHNPDLILFDEPDSGVDVENVELLGRTINEMLDKQKKPSDRKRSGLIITHHGSILDLVDVDRAHVLYNGSIMCSGKPKEILEEIIENGYENCAKCYQIEQN